ncbi:MAG: UvrD-helicase domain-containing protein, partial [Treponemataceae bacterium]
MEGKSLLNELDEQQVNAVCVEKNAVISAGAGSGKTKVLATRFVYLILEKKCTVDQILTLTFTKKAANEMYDRIYKTLQEHAQKGNREAQKALSDFFSARIMTLDSYCSSIVKSCAYLYGIQPDFSIDPEKIKELTFNLALQFIIDNRKNTGMQAILAKNTVSQAAEVFFTDIFFNHSTICNPIDFAHFFTKQNAIIAEKWQENYIQLIDELSVLNQICTPDINQPSVNAVIEILQSYDFTTLSKKTFSDQSLFLPKENQTIVKIIALSTALSQVRIPTNKKSPFPEIKTSLKNLRLINSHLVSLANYIVHYDAMQSLVPLLEDFQNQFIHIKRSMGILTFSDVSTLALDILKNNLYTRNIEKNSIQKIMIDEFQDNNRLQKDLLFLLAEKLDRTEKSIPKVNELRNDVLFFVGDEKQSIYAFRGADVSVFRSLSDELNSCTTQLEQTTASAPAINLLTNYRSNPSLIGAFNFLFGSYRFPSCAKDFLEKQKRLLTPTIFCKQEDNPLLSLPLYEAEYSWVKAHIKENHTEQNILSPHLRYNFYLNQTSEENENEEKIGVYEIEAEFVAQKIKSLHDEQNIPFHQIAILFRTLTHQHLFEMHLRKKNIPYKTDQLTGFFADSPVNDLYALLRLIIYPHDLHTYATVLTGPFVQMSVMSASVCIAHITPSKIVTDEQYLVNEFTPFDEKIEIALHEQDRIKYQTG